MTAYQIYCELRKVGGWAEETRKVLWLAARYYANVDSYDEMRECLQDQPGKADMIRMLR